MRSNGEVQRGIPTSTMYARQFTVGVNSLPTRENPSGRRPTIRPPRTNLISSLSAATPPPAAWSLGTAPLAPPGSLSGSPDSELHSHARVPSRSGAAHHGGRRIWAPFRGRRRGDERGSSEEPAGRGEIHGLPLETLDVHPDLFRTRRLSLVKCSARRYCS